MKRLKKRENIKIMCWRNGRMAKRRSEETEQQQIRRKQNTEKSRKKRE
jgi:hypothetical protein